MLIYSFCRYSLCLSQGSRAVFTRRRLFSQSKSNLLLGLVMGTDMKITESRECTDIVRADWGQTVCGTQINAKKQCRHERSMGGTSGTSVH